MHIMWVLPLIPSDVQRLVWIEIHRLLVRRLNNEYESLMIVITGNDGYMYIIKSYVWNDKRYTSCIYNYRDQRSFDMGVHLNIKGPTSHKFNIPLPKRYRYSNGTP